MDSQIMIFSAKKAVTFMVALYFIDHLEYACIIPSSTYWNCGLKGQWTNMSISLLLFVFLLEINSKSRELWINWLLRIMSGLIYGYPSTQISTLIARMKNYAEVQFGTTQSRRWKVHKKGLCFVRQSIFKLPIPPFSWWGQIIPSCCCNWEQIERVNNVINRLTPAAITYRTVELTECIMRTFNAEMCMIVSIWQLPHARECINHLEWSMRPLLNDASSRNRAWI